MLAIIGGTGLSRLTDLQVLETYDISTPFGMPSSPVVRGKRGEHEILFLTRHGSRRHHLPHEINYRANIYALKSIGATQIIGISACGSLRETIAPGDLALPCQYFDWTRGRRANSFFGDGVAAHVSTAEPVSKNLTRWIAAHAAKLELKLHDNVTYGCVEGPRLGTRAESRFLRQAGCDLVGMTNVPEAFLAREAQICYATIGIATDYDCWMEDPAMHVSVSGIFELYRESLGKANRLLESLLNDARPLEEPEIRKVLASSMLTQEESLNENEKAWLEVLKR